MSNYQTDGQQSWYAPLERQTPPEKKTEAPKKKKRLTTPRKIALGVAALVALIAGSSLLFSTGAPETPAEEPKPTFSMPGPAVRPDRDDELPEDFKDFFSDFYITDDKRGDEIRIPITKDVPDFTLQFEEPGEELSLQELYERCSQSVVSIIGEVDGYDAYWGSGIVMSADGLILTNTHLLEDCDGATVILPDGGEYEALLVGADATSDIAVMKIAATGLTPAVFADSATLRVGDRVAAIGNPIGEEFHLTLTDGIVSGLDRGVGQYGRNVTAIQNTAAINEGSSGGALLNMCGQVVGVTNMKMSAPSGQVTIEGMSLAVPSALVRTVVDALIRDGEVRGRTALGITVGPIPSSAATHYELPQGLYVSSVSPGSDAAAQGVREGDIMTAVNGETLVDTDQVYRAKDGLKVGDTLHLSFWRDGESFELDVALVDYNDVYGKNKK